MKGIAERDQKAILPTYARLPLVLERGKGVFVWDDAGRRYLDFACGISVTNLGHSHPALTRAIAAQAARLCHVSNLVVQRPQVELAEALLKAAPFAERVAFANSGAEANEVLIKIARRHGAATGRHEILAFHGAFHGRTYGALSASGQAKLHKGMEPLLPGFRHVPYNDLEAARSAVGRHTAAILVEPVQGENGVRPGDDGFLVGLRRLADRQGILLLLDEIQTGLGRTGTLFAYEHLGQDCVPDAMSLAKSLGGGLPLSAVLVGARAASALALGEHGSTMGGNPVACAAGLVQLKALRSAGFMKKVLAVGAILKEGLEALRVRRPDVVLEVRGRGLMLGLALSVPSKPLVLDCLKRGLIVNSTADSVIRLLPPLCLSPAEARQGLAILSAAILDVAPRSSPVFVPPTRAPRKSS